MDTLDGFVLTERTILADKIVAHAITAEEIAAKTITANEILAGTITSAEIAAGTITGANIKAGEITTGHVSSDFGKDLDLAQQLMVMFVCILGGIGTAGIPAGSLPVVAMIVLASNPA